MTHFPKPVPPADGVIVRLRFAFAWWPRRTTDVGLVWRRDIQIVTRIMPGGARLTRRYGWPSHFWTASVIQGLAFRDDGRWYSRYEPWRK